MVMVISWAFLYMYKIQEVLPEYKWDLREVCRSFIQELTSLENLHRPGHG